MRELEFPLKTGNYWTYKVYTSDGLDDTSRFTIGNYVSMNGYHGFSMYSSIMFPTVLE